MTDRSEHSKVTIAIPFYSNLSYLKLAVESVLKQTISSWTLIVVDDFGPEGDAARSYIDSIQDHRIRFFRNEFNLGLAGNWNRCLELSNTDLVALLHADDCLKPMYCEFMMSLLSRNQDASLGFCGADIIDQYGRPVFSVADRYKKFLLPSAQSEFLLEGEDGLKALAHGNFIMCPTVMYRRSMLEGQVFDSRWRMVLDLEFFTRLILQGELLVGTPQSFYSYRRHPESQTTQLTDTMTRFQEEVNVLDHIADCAEKKGWLDAAAVARKKRVVMLNLSYLVLKDVCKGRWSQLIVKLRFLGGM